MLVSRNPIRHVIAAVLVAAFLPLSAQALEIEAPEVALTGVPLEYTVAGASAGATVTLEFGDTRLEAIADADGAAFDGHGRWK